MREIKFRSWSGGQMISLDYIDRYGIAHWHENSIPASTDKLMQYTGLKDKGGKEIYEGDIIIIRDTYKDRILDDGTGPTEPCNHLAPVAFKYAEFGVELEHGADIFHSGFWSFADIERETGQNEFEVIGNIYENPELLLK